MTQADRVSVWGALSSSATFIRPPPEFRTRIVAIGSTIAQWAYVWAGDLSTGPKTQFYLVHLHLVPPFVVIPSKYFHIFCIIYCAELLA